MRYLTILLLAVSMASAVVMDGTARRDDCALFNLLISAPMHGNDETYITMIGTESGLSTYNVLLPNDIWNNDDTCWGIVYLCCLAAGHTSQQSAYTSDKCNVLFRDRMYTMTTANCRRLIDMRGTESQLLSWVRTHCTCDTEIGCDLLIGLGALAE